MKFSEIDTDRGLDVLCECVPLISAIASDEELMAELKRKVKVSEEELNEMSTADIIEIGIDKIDKLALIILKKKRDIVLSILAVIDGKTKEEVAKQNFLITAKEVVDLVTDKEFINFFKSCVQQVKNG